MSTDIENTYSDNAAFTTTPNVSTNAIDHGPGGRGPGPSRGLYLVISCGTAWTNSTTSLTFTLESTDATSGGNPDFSSPTDVAIYAVTTRPKLGELLLQVALPTITERYTRLTAVWTTTETTGTISSYLTTDPQATFEGRAA